MQLGTRPIFALALACLSNAVLAVSPPFGTATRSVRLDGVRIGADLTPNTNNSLRFTVAYDPARRLFHIWTLRTDDPAFPPSDFALPNVVHATARDGLNFVSDGQLSYGIGSVARSSFGATIEPPIYYPRAVADRGTWKLLAWHPNIPAAPVGTWGDYIYNTSINDLGTTPDNRSVTHQGPLPTGAGGGPGGNHVGAFGLVNGQLYLRVDSPVGGVVRFNYVDAIPPLPASGGAEGDLFQGTPYCWGLNPTCTGPTPIPAYVHNAGRTLRHPDGSLGTYYAFRDWSTGARLDKQVWYVESVNDGLNWSAASGVFTNGNAVTVDGSPTAANGFFSNIDAVEASDACRLYFSTRDSNGVLVLVSATTGGACDVIFADGFDFSP